MPRRTLTDVQDAIRAAFGHKDAARGAAGTFVWFMEEVGEMAATLRKGSPEDRAAEFADVLAWLATLANITGVDLDAAFEAKYGAGCPYCRSAPCTCDAGHKP